MHFHVHAPLLLDMIIPLNETRPHILIFPMNWYNEQETYFMKLLLFQYFSLIVLGIAAISSSSVYLSALQYVCAMFRIIGCLLDNILKDKKNKLKIINDDAIYVRIIRIIQMHNKTIEFIDGLNNKFNTSYLIVMACALCYIGITIVQLLGEYENRSNMVMLILSIFYIIFHLVWGFTFCYMGQHLQNVSEAIFCKAYAIPWYLLPKKSQRLLFFVIARAAKPSYVWIGKTFIASFEFFTALVRSAISYAMILRYLMQIMNDWSDIRETEQFEVLLDYAFLNRKCIFIFILSYNTYISFMFLSSLTPLLLDLTVPLNESRPYTLIIPMNWYTGQERHFLKILIFQLIISMILGLCVISSFSMSILILQHVCAMFHIIGCLLDNILNVKEKNLKAIDDEVICKRIIHIIKIHSKTIQYIDVFNKIFNVIFLVLLTCALCFVGIALISILEIFGEFKNSLRDIGSLSLPIFYIIFHLIWIFVFCHIGQYLQNISETTFYKAYDTPWYLFSKQSQRLLSFLIARSYKPAYVSIGKMFMASHEFFTGVRNEN
ncbi:hypothetical protein HZH66_000107 [Vespula vulgaris]|uniref:Odorant receptor n=1 Tax=Vespula vulgaris TaxID=7454 RepID=A0A834KW25_VESVU|nr:hypothetical protein HZH66_000107 [Vespula vulgaris]